MTSEDGKPLAAARPGQFVVLRVQTEPDSPPLLRSYSLSDVPSTDHYRVSVKEELHGAVSGYLKRKVQTGDLLDVSAPRGNFILQPDEDPIVLLSAGIGATPVLAMLHALASAGAARPVWWLFGARNREDHPFAAEARGLVKALPSANSYVKYSQPAAKTESAWILMRPVGSPWRTSRASVFPTALISICVARPRSWRT